MKYLLISIASILLYSCSDNKFKYVEVKKSPGGSLSEGRPEEIIAKSDSEAYTAAYSRYCLSKYLSISTNEDLNNPQADIAVDFKLLNAEGRDIAKDVKFVSKDSIERSIAKKSAMRVAELGDGSAKILNEFIADSTFEVISTKHNKAVQNYYVLIKSAIPPYDSLQTWAIDFKAKVCSSNCNISIYDERVPVSLIESYPQELGRSGYLYLADHFVAYLSFELSEISLYPYQDKTYRDFGGKNWKK
jgi:hypothetical protein